MTASRRVILGLSAAALAAPRAARAAFPDRPLRIIVPFAAGTSSDVQARLVAPLLQTRLGQPVVVENRAGGGGTVGAEAVARARADGYTLLLGSNGPLTNNPVLQARLSYDADRDFAPIAMMSRSPLTLSVRTDSPLRDVAAYVAAARARPGAVSIGSSGQGSATHFLIEQFMAQAEIRLNHVPYRGSSQSVPDLVAGNVASVMGEISTVMPLYRGGQVRILAMTSAARMRLFPELPTLGESGLPGLVGGSWSSLVTTAGSPPEAVEAVAAAVSFALADEAYAARQAELAAELVSEAERTPAGFGAWLAAERGRIRAIAERAGIRAD